MLTLTPAAAAHITSAREQSGIPNDAHLRVAPASDQGPGQIGLGFVDQPFDGDHVGDAHGVNYCVAAEIAPELDAAQLDIAEDGASMVLVPAD